MFQCLESYLEADLVRRTLGVSLDGVGCRHGGGVDGAVVWDEEPVTPIIELEPVEDGPTRDDWSGQVGETAQISGEQSTYRVLESQR